MGVCNSEAFKGVMIAYHTLSDSNFYVRKDKFIKDFNEISSKLFIMNI